MKCYVVCLGFEIKNGIKKEILQIEDEVEETKKEDEDRKTKEKWNEGEIPTAPWLPILLFKVS